MDLSIVIPAIRPHRWVDVYNSAKLSCTKYSFEIIFVGPYGPPDELKDNPQIKYIKDFGTPTRCAQIGVCYITGTLITNSSDDAMYYPEALDKAIDLYYRVNNSKDAIILRYREGVNFSGIESGSEYWFAKNAYPNRAFNITQGKHAANYCFEELNIPDHYKQGSLILMSKEYFVDIGGYDCIFEHLAWASHDFCYRVQRDGGVLHPSITEVLNADHIIDSNYMSTLFIAVTQYDGPLLRQMQKDPNIINRIKIPFDNWKNSPEVWARRFPEGKPN